MKKKLKGKQFALEHRAGKSQSWAWNPVLKPLFLIAIAFSKV
jgi:hypothetical protein